MSIDITDILDIVSRQNHWRRNETINLIASENVQSDAVKNIEVNDSIILYDYYTPKRFRRKGKYQELLDSIIMNINKDVFIYTLSNNRASNIAIQKVGFKKVKEVRKEGMNFMFMEIKKNLEKT